MKLRKMLYGLTLMLSCLALASCVNDEEEICLPENSTHVIFSLVLQDNAQTRAEWGENTYWINGVGKDNDIDLSSVKILIFDQENNYKGTLQDLRYTPKVTNQPNYYEATKYEFVGTVPAEYNLTQNATYKFVVLANCSNIPADVNVESLNDELLFSQNSNKIPMWGVKTAQLTLVPGARQDMGVIALLRAMSKITVKLSPEMIANGFSLESLQLDKYNSQGYVLPTGAFDFAETSKLDQEGCVRPLASVATSPLVGTVANDSVVLYVPEYKNIESTTPATMSVTLKLTEEVEVVDESGTHTTTVVDHLPFPAGIEFKNYVEGAATADSEYDIVRNHHYIFTITDAKVGHRLQFEVLTVPWDDEVVRLDYKESISWKDGGKPKWTYPPTTTTGTETIDNINYTVLNVKGGDEISCSFTLDAPAGWLWYAELDPLTEGAQNFITFTNGSTSANGTVGQAATLYLKINSQTTSVVHKSRLRLYVRTPSNDRSIEVGSEDVRYIISREF